MKKMLSKGKGARKHLSFAILPVCLACASLNVAAQDADVYVEPAAVATSDVQTEDAFKFGGYVRAWAGINLNDTPELGADGKPIDGKGKLSMLRGSAALHGSTKTGALRWYGSIRGDLEGNTSYQRNLQRTVQANTVGAPGPGSDLMKELSGLDLRELYFDTDLGERVKLRVGKQQIVWGETDFFHPSDVIHGFDYRWRQFYEPESDELRKPLFMINAKIDVPELQGTLQAFVRPGLDRKKDIGNSYDLYGGRWMPQPYHGQDFLAPSAYPYNYEHAEGDYKDWTGGLRWTGWNDSFNYALSYATTFQGDPTLIAAGMPNIGSSVTPGSAGNFIFPKISVAAASFSTELLSIDSVVNGEIAYQSGNMFNTGPFGFGGVIQKNVIKTTLRIDKQLRLQEWLGTNQASFSSLQLFDSWIKNYDQNDNMVAFAGYPAKMKSHDTVLTAFIVLNYMNSKLNPMIAVGKNLSTGDAFLIPSVTYMHGDNWRFTVEADIFHTKHEPSVSNLANSTESYPLSDFLSNRDQLTFRATYQF